MMNYLFQRSASIDSSVSRQSLAALVSAESLHLPSLIPAKPLSSATAGVFWPFNGITAVENVGFGGVPWSEFYFSTGPLGFRATDVAFVEYAVEDFYDEEKGSAKRGDEGLEIAQLGIS